MKETNDEHFRDNTAVLASATRSATYNIGIQMTFRVLTFLMNLMIVRYISKDLYGIINISMLPLYTTIFGLVSEPFVRAGLSKPEKRCWPEFVNLMWLVFPVGIICSILASLLWIYSSEKPDPAAAPHYDAAMAFYVASALIELFSRPHFVVCQLLLLVEFVAVVEGIALMFQCIVTVTLVIVKPEWGLITFALAQLLYSSIITVSYCCYFAYLYLRQSKSSNFPFKSVGDFLPTLRDQPYLSSEQRSLWSSFAIQSVLKTFMTEGEKYIMKVSGVITYADQGVYTAASNLGSLVVRILFLPMENSFYLFVSQTLQRGVPLKRQPKEAADLVSQVLGAVLQIRVLIGLTIAVYGYNYSALALDILFGQQYSEGSGPQLLRWISIYVLLVSINGITEGFKTASMSQPDVKQYNQAMLLLWLIFLTSTLYLTKVFHSLGFVLANCLNMLLRILHSAYYIYWYFKDSSHNPIWSHFPSMAMFVGYVFIFCITAGSEVVVFDNSREWKDRFWHIAIGSICLLCNMLVFYFTQQPLIYFIRKFFFGKVRTDKNESENSKTR